MARCVLRMAYKPLILSHFFIIVEYVQNSHFPYQSSGAIIVLKLGDFTDRQTSDLTYFSL